MVTLTCLLGFGSWAKQVKIFLEKGNGPTPLQVSGAGEMFHSYIPHWKISWGIQCPFRFLPNRQTQNLLSFGLKGAKWVVLLPISFENAQGVSQSVPLMQEKSCGKYGTVRAHQLEASNAFILRAQKPALTHGGQCDSFLWCCCSCCEAERNNLSHRVAAFLDSACGDCCAPHSTLSMSDAASDDTERRSHGADDAAAAGGGRTPVAAAPPDPLPQLRAERQTLKHQLKVATKQIRNEAGPGFEEPLSGTTFKAGCGLEDSKISKNHLEPNEVRRGDWSHRTCFGVLRISSYGS